MSKKSFARLIRIATGTFGSASEDSFAVEKGLTRLERFVHFWVLVWQSFRRNRCPVRASALSFTTLLALIPMLAVAMSVSSFFLKAKSEEQIKTFVEQFIEHLVPAPVGFTNETATIFPTFPDGVDADPTKTNSADSPVVVGEAAAMSVTNAPAAVSDQRIEDAKKRAADTIFKFIQSTQSGKLGIVAVLFLLWTTILMLTRVEETFNDIWGVVQGRGWLARIVLYWAAITLGTMLVVAAVGLASGPHFEKTRALLTDVPFLEPLLSTLLPILIICVTFAMFYKLVPNTRVDFSAAFVGGTLAGTAWHLFNVFSLRIATSAVTASKIYGSLALVPLLMMGLYGVWVIVLFGAQVAYAFQNRESYLQERLAENVNQRGREFVALRLMTCIGQRFDRGLPPPTTQEISRELGIPSKLVQQVLQTLLAARLVVEVSGAAPAYAPARPLEAINAHHILIAMRATHGQDFITHDEPVREEIYGEFIRIQAAEERAASSVTMLALVHRAQARLAPATSSPLQLEALPAGTLVASDEATVSRSSANTVAAEASQASDMAHAEKDFRPAAPEVTSPVQESAIPPIEIAQSISPEKPTASSAAIGDESFPL